MRLIMKKKGFDTQIAIWVIHQTLQNGNYSYFVGGDA